MMDEISSHIMDIAMNAITAHAKRVEVTIVADPKESLLTLFFKDDGIGMDEDMVKRVQDPFFSTKTGKKVGLGIPLLKGTAETTGGTFSLTSQPGKGVEICASFRLNHPDLPPLGKLKDTILVLIIGNPDIDFLFKCTLNEREFILDTASVRNILGDVPLNDPEVVKFFIKHLDENL
ncbi:MAG TPA: sensor histidine kinase [Syntrophorhabdaceae bacterium]|nr:sensor histidine kinase [Syntrophorhabdaceae bacterium]